MSNPTKSSASSGPAKKRHFAATRGIASSLPLPGRAGASKRTEGVLSSNSSLVSRPRIGACAQCIRLIAKDPAAICERDSKYKNCRRCERAKGKCEKIDHYHAMQVQQLQNLQQRYLALNLPAPPPIDKQTKTRPADAHSAARDPVLIPLQRAAESLVRRLATRKKKAPASLQERKVVALESIALSLRRVAAAAKVTVGAYGAEDYVSDFSEGSDLSEEDEDEDGDGDGDGDGQ